MLATESVAVDSALAKVCPQDALRVGRVLAHCSCTSAVSDVLVSHARILALKCDFILVTWRTRAPPLSFGHFPRERGKPCH